MVSHGVSWCLMVFLVLTERVPTFQFEIFRLGPVMEKLNIYLRSISNDPWHFTEGQPCLASSGAPSVSICQFTTVNLHTTILSTQKLGEEPSDKHRQSCDEATKPLLDTLEELIVFTSSAKFTSSPAKISQEGQRTQQPLIEVSQLMSLKSVS